MPSAFDPQQISNEDDGSPGGRQKTRDIVGGGLARMAFRQGDLQISKSDDSVSASMSENFENPDGSVSQLFVKLLANPVPSASNTFSYALINFSVRGPVVGIRFTRNYFFGNVLASIPFDVSIDNVYYHVDPTYFLADSGQPVIPQASGGYNVEGAVILANNLSEGNHNVQISCQNTLQDTTSTPAWVFYGYLAARASGYSEYPRLGFPFTPTAVPTSYGPLPQSITAASKYYGVRLIKYYNTSVTDAIVKLNLKGTEFEAIPVPAGKSVDWDPKQPIGSWFNIQHISSVSGVVCTVFGAQ